MGNKLRQYSNKDENNLYDEDLYYGDAIHHNIYNC